MEKQVLGRDRDKGELCSFLDITSRNLALNPENAFYVINSLPKCASSYLFNLLEKVLVCKKRYLSNQDFRTNEQDLYLPSLLDACHDISLSRHHFRATDQNIEYIERFNIKPIILVRNIFDIVVSFRDNQVNGIREKEEIEYSYSILGYFDESYLELDEEEQYDYIIDTCAPWLFNFVASWVNAESRGMRLLWLEYSELIENPVSVLLKISDYYNLSLDTEVLEGAVNESSGQNILNNFNRGVVGRGKKNLTRSQIDRIYKLSSYYSTQDLSLLGI